jgi:hypothetical protein
MTPHARFLKWCLWNLGTAILIALAVNEHEGALKVLYVVIPMLVFGSFMLGMATASPRNNGQVLPALFPMWVLAPLWIAFAVVLAYNEYLLLAFLSLARVYFEAERAHLNTLMEKHRGSEAG